MGRRKIQIQPLPESQIRAKFKKRKDGLVKKAYELGTLCGAQVALIIFSKDGEEVVDEGFNATTLEIIDRYWKRVLGCGDQSTLPQQQIAALQVPELQPNPASSSQAIPMDSRVQLQQEVVMDPDVQQNLYMNSQVLQDRFVNPQALQDQHLNSQVPQDQFVNSHMHQDQFVNSQVLQDQFVNSHMHQDQFVNSQMHQDQFVNSQVLQDQFMNAQQVHPYPYMNSQVQQDQLSVNPNAHRQQQVPTDPCMQQLDQQMNPHRQQLQEASTSADPCMQQNVYVNPHGQQSMRTGVSQLQQGLQYSFETNQFVGTSNYKQDMVEGNQQVVHALGHGTRFDNQTYVRYNGLKPSKRGSYYN